VRARVCPTCSSWALLLQQQQRGSLQQGIAGIVTHAGQAVQCTRHKARIICCPLMLPLPLLLFMSSSCLCNP
jgi:hypothetical protein